MDPITSFVLFIVLAAVALTALYYVVKAAIKNALAEDRASRTPAGGPLDQRK